MSDFDEFVNTRGPSLLRFAYLLSGDAHQAEDIVQEPWRGRTCAG